MAGALADTSAIVDSLRGDANAYSVLQRHRPIYLPAIVLGELFLGQARSRFPARQQQELKVLLASAQILSVTATTATFYARTRAALLAAGTPIPENDTWIAALALEHDLPLIARDAHFDRVVGLSTVRW